jgi:PKD repeat protein
VTHAFGPSAVGQSLYYTTYAGGGSVRRIDGPVANQPPTAALGAAPTSGTAPLGVSFDATGSNDPDGDALEYQFTFGDGSSTTTSSPTVAHTYTGPGSYTASLVVSDGRGGVSAPATRLISVVGGNSPPQPTIAAPGPLDTYAVGQTVTLSGSATDAEDGTLPSSALSWTVILHHDTHTHPFLGPVSGTGISFTTPPPEDLAATSTSYLEIRLTATDSAGASTTIVRDFQPTIVPITFETQPSGLTLVVNGVSITGPTTVTSWQGYALNVSAPTQVNGNKTYAFQRWSDGGAESHTILTPGTAEAYSAKF